MRYVADTSIARRERSVGDVRGVLLDAIAFAGEDADENMEFGISEEQDGGCE